MSLASSQRTILQLVDVWFRISRLSPRPFLDPPNPYPEARPQDPLVSARRCTDGETRQLTKQATSPTSPATYVTPLALIPTTTSYEHLHVDVNNHYQLRILNQAIHQHSSTAAPTHHVRPRTNHKPTRAVPPTRSVPKHANDDADLGHRPAAARAGPDGADGVLPVVRSVVGADGGRREPEHAAEGVSDHRFEFDCRALWGLEEFECHEGDVDGVD